MDIIKKCLILVMPALTGCVATSKQMGNYEACMSDPTCALQVKNVAESTGGIVGVIGSALISPISVPVAAIVTMIAALIGGMYYGGMKQKEQDLNKYGAEKK